MRTGIRALLVAALATLPVLPIPALAAPPVPDTSLNGQWWFAALQVSKIWASGAQGQGVTIAVLDTGVNATRPELAGRVVPGRNLATGTGDGRIDGDRPRGHGTAMALLIAAQGGPSGLVGIAPQARILPVRIAPESGQTEQWMATGIRWSADHGARVISTAISLTGSCPADVQDAVRYAVGKGSAVVASAGNSGNAGNPPQTPANCAGVVSVGAVDAARHPWTATARQPYVDVAAPGVNMASINLAGQPGKSDGTSDASALTAAAIALIWSKFPQLTNRQVVARLLATLRDDADRPGPDEATGRGLIRPYNAITTRVPPDAANPVFDELDQLDAPATTGPSTGGGADGAQPPAAGAGSSRSGGAGVPGALVVLGGLALAVCAGLGLVLVLVLSRCRRAPTPSSWPPAQQSWPPAQPPRPPAQPSWPAAQPSSPPAQPPWPPPPDGPPHRP